MFKMYSFMNFTSYTDSYTVLSYIDSSSKSGYRTYFNPPPQKKSFLDLTFQAPFHFTPNP